jgi:hypothetical protein
MRRPRKPVPPKTVTLRMALPVGGAVVQRSADSRLLSHWAVQSIHWRVGFDLRAFVRSTAPPAIVAGGTIFRLVGEGRRTKPADLHDPVSSVEG